MVEEEKEEYTYTLIGRSYSNDETFTAEFQGLID
jgi:hypothetical protein